MAGPAVDLNAGSACRSGSDVGGGRPADRTGRGPTPPPTRVADSCPQPGNSRSVLSNTYLTAQSGCLPWPTRLLVCATTCLFYRCVPNPLFDLSTFLPAGLSSVHPPVHPLAAFLYSVCLSVRCPPIFRFSIRSLPSYIPSFYPFAALLYSVFLSVRCLPLFRLSIRSLPSYIPSFYPFAALLYSVFLSVRCPILRLSIRSLSSYIPSFYPFAALLYSVFLSARCPHILRLSIRSLSCYTPSFYPFTALYPSVHCRLLFCMSVRSPRSCLPPAHTAWPSDHSSPIHHRRLVFSLLHPVLRYPVTQRGVSLRVWLVSRGCVGWGRSGPAVAGRCPAPSAVTRCADSAAPLPDGRPLPICSRRAWRTTDRTCLAGDWTVPRPPPPLLPVSLWNAVSRSAAGRPSSSFAEA